MRGTLAALGALLLLVATPAAHAGWEPPASPGPAGSPAALPSLDTTTIAQVPYVAWVEGTSPRVARLTAAGWQSLDVQSSIPTAGAIAIAADATGAPVVLTTAGDDLRIARFTGGAWTADAPFTASGTAINPDLALVGADLWTATTETPLSSGTEVHVRRRTPAGALENRGTPQRVSSATFARLSAIGATAAVAFLESGTSTRAHASLNTGGTTWTPITPAGGATLDLDGVAAGAGPAATSVDVHVIGSELQVAIARGASVRLVRVSGTNALSPVTLTTAAPVTTVALRPASTGGYLAYAEATTARVARTSPTSITPLTGAAPSTQLTGIAPTLGLTAPGGVPVLVAREPGATVGTQTLAVRHLLPDFLTNSFTATQDTVTLSTIAGTSGAELPIGFQRSRGAPEQVGFVTGDGVSTTRSATFGGLAPDTPVPWRPVTVYGPLVFGPAVDGLARTNRAPATQTPPPPPETPPAAPPAAPDPPQAGPVPPTEPVPTLGRTAAVDATSGRVVVTRPGGKPQRLGERAGLLPIGTKVDVTRGRVELWFATPDGKGQYRGFFYQGTFRIQSQDRRTGLVTFQLARPTQCGTSRGRARTARKKKNKVWGDAKGKFRTRGRFAAATVRGTKWSTEDACDRTTVRVVNGVVDVQNLITKRTTRLRAGRSSTARRR